MGGQMGVFRLLYDKTRSVVAEVSSRQGQALLDRLGQMLLLRHPLEKILIVNRRKGVEWQRFQKVTAGMPRPRS